MLNFCVLLGARLALCSIGRTATPSSAKPTPSGGTTTALYVSTISDALARPRIQKELSNGERFSRVTLTTWDAATSAPSSSSSLSSSSSISPSIIHSSILLLDHRLTVLPRALQRHCDCVHPAALRRWVGDLRDERERPGKGDRREEEAIEERSRHRGGTRPHCRCGPKKNNKRGPDPRVQSSRRQVCVLRHTKANRRHESC